VSRQTFAAVLGSLCFLLLAQFAVLQWRLVDLERVLLRNVESSNTRHRTALHYLSLLQDIETGQRGFVVTGNPEFLQPLNFARGELLPSGKELADLYPRGTPERDLAADLVRTGEAKALYSYSIVHLRTHEGQQRSSTAMVNGVGKRLMDRARSLTAAIEQRESEHARSILIAASSQRSKLQGMVFGVAAALLVSALALIGMLLATNRDLSRSSGSLKDAGRRLSAIFDNATDAMIMLDADGRVVSTNNAAERLLEFDCSPHEGGQAISFSDLTSAAFDGDYLDGVVRGSAARSQTFVGRRCDGSSYETEIVTTPLHLQDGLQFLVVGRDVTERRRIERMKTDFVATVSHELRTPLTSISGSLGLLAGGAGGEIGSQARRLIEIALNNSQRLIRLINDILDIEKIESGKLELEPENLSLADLLHDVVEANQGMAAKSDICLQIQPIAPGACIIADHDRMIQVLTNLLSNAIKFSPPKGVVTLSAERRDSSWRISVSDFGPGVPEEFRRRIFDKFAQADGGATRMAGGSGLGLSIVKQIVIESGGSVSFDSEVGKGSTFHVDMPVPAPAPPDDNAAFEPKPLSDDRPHILHVEDDVDMLRLMASSFGSEADVHSTPSVQEAKASLRRFRYDLVLLDIVMQDGNGSDLIPLIRNVSPETRIVVFTAHDVTAADAAKVDLVAIKSRTSLADLTALVGRMLSPSVRKVA
jgi:PAS domain S-box-containing protein